MEIVYNEEDLARYMNADVVVESEHPVLIDRFLTNAIEVDVDALSGMTSCASQKRDGPCGLRVDLVMGNRNLGVT